jgi:hypothetical protein
MQNAAGGGIETPPDDRNHTCRSVASDLESLIDHVQASLRLIESAIDRETCAGNHDAASNIIVLDDVTPRYAKASTALKACDAGLGIALHFLLDSSASQHGAREPAGIRPALSVVGASADNRA